MADYNSILTGTQIDNTISSVRNTNGILQSDGNGNISTYDIEAYTNSLQGKPNGLATLDAEGNLM